MRKAITAGEIDIYPEYTGNAGFFFNKADDPLWKDAAKGYEAAKKLDYDANKIVWLDPSPANNTWAIAVRKDVADPNKLATMSDFGKWVAGGGAVKLAASAEFVEFGGGPAGLPDSLRLQDEARATHRAVRRRHGGDHQGGGRADQRRQRRHGLRHRRRHRAVGPRGARGRQERPARLCAGADHPRGCSQGKPEDRRDPEADLRNPSTSTTLQGLNARVQVGGEPAKSRSRADYLKSKGFLK